MKINTFMLINVVNLTMHLYFFKSKIINFCMLFPKVYSNVALKHPKSFNFFQNLNFSLPFPQRPNKNAKYAILFLLKGKKLLIAQREM